jgi:hypothetical protein
VHEGYIGACLRPSTAAEEAARQARGCIFSCKKKEWLIIEVVTLLEYVNNF